MMVVSLPDETTHDWIYRAWEISMKVGVAKINQVRINQLNSRGSINVERERLYIYIYIYVYIYIHIHIYIYTYIYSLGQKTTSTTGPLKRVSRVPVPFDKPLLVALLLILLLRSLKSPFFLGKRLEVFDGADMIFMRCSNAIWMLGCWLCVVTLLKSEIVVYTYTISCHHISSSTCT